MNITPTPINGLCLIEPKCYEDERGFFLESYQTKRYQAAGIRDAFVQDNHSRSKKGVLRGLHFQVKRPQAQIVTVMRGCIFDVAVDLRRDSPSFGTWYGIELNDHGPRQLFMAPGFAHGFYVLSEWADLHYKVSQFYDSSDEGGVLWNDPDIGIQWPVETPEIAVRDATYPHLRDLDASNLPNRLATEN